MGDTPKQAAFQRLVQNEEILTLIFRNFLPLDPTSLPRPELVEGRKQLRDIAIASKSFTSTALDCLWTYLDSLEPLIATLPNVQSTGKTYAFHGTLPTESIFCQYARRVRVLSLGTSEVNKEQPETLAIPPHVYTMIAKELAGRPLFPGLKKFNFQPEVDLFPKEVAAAFPLVFSPFTETATFSGPGLSNPLFSTFVLPLAAKESGRLKDLTLQCTTQRIPQFQFGAILRLTHLESLDLTLPEAEGVPPTMLAEMGVKFKNLRTLILDVHFPNHQVAKSTNSTANVDDTEMFPSLTSARVTSRATLSPICPCIPPFLLAKTTILVVVVAGIIENADHFKPVADAVKSHPSIGALELIGTPTTIIKNSTCITPFFDQALGLESVNLRKISISPERNNHIGYSLGKPPNTCLKHLVLPEIPTPTGGIHFREIDALFNIAISFGLLETLTISFNIADVLEWFKIQEEEGLKKEWMTRCNLRRLVIKDCRPSLVFSAQLYNDLARFLDQAFPNLESIAPYSPSDLKEPYWRDHWWFIEDLRIMRQKVRRMEIAEKNMSKSLKSKRKEKTVIDLT